MAAAGSKVVTLGKRDFKAKVFNYAPGREWKFEGDRPAVIDFYADWCAPCKMVSPILDELSVEYDGRVRFYKVNTEKDPEVAKAFGISSIPTLLFAGMEGNPVVLRGAQSKQALAKQIGMILPGEKRGLLGRIFSLGK